MSRGPRAARPYMPGYGVKPAAQGTGLLPWSWAESQLRSSRNYWLGTSWPDGRPHLMPVWAVWHQDRLWFSSSRGSRKARNLRSDPRCVISTEDAANPIVVEGTVEVVTDQADLELMLRLENDKYGTDYGIDTLDPTASTAFRIRPAWVFALQTADFTGSPTKWRF